MSTLFEQTARDPRFKGGIRGKSAVLLAAMALPIALLVAMLALTPLGHWQMDELLMMRAFQLNGLPALVARIVDWSPRPFSEALLYVYSTVVHATGRQLTGTFLLALWGMLIAACLLPVILIRTGDNGGRRVTVLVALTVLALLISGHPVSEVFYWTQAAGAYIPSIALIAAPLLCLVLVRDRNVRLDAVVAVCIALAALSSEVGAIFGLAWSAGAPLLLWLGRWTIGERPVIRRGDAQFLIPLAAGLVVIVLLANARFGSEAEIFDPAIARQLGASIWTTLATFPTDVLPTDLGTPTGSGLLLGILSRRALFALCVWLSRAWPGRPASTSGCWWLRSASPHSRAPSSPCSRLTTSSA